MSDEISDIFKIKQMNRNLIFGRLIACVLGIGDHNHPCTKDKERFL